MNLLEPLQSTIDQSLTNQLSNLINEEASKASKAVDLILPTLLGAMTQKAATCEGSAIIGQVLSEDDGSLYNHLSSILKGSFGGIDRLNSSGKGLIEGLLGPRTDSVVEIITEHSDLTCNGVRELMTLVTPIVFSVLGREKSRHQLNSEGISELLLDQRQHLRSHLPAGLASALGIVGLYQKPRLIRTAPIDQTLEQDIAKRSAVDCHSARNRPARIALSMFAVGILGFGFWKFALPVVGGVEGIKEMMKSREWNRTAISEKR